jgi:uncharacterized protein (DUF433 family)
MSQPTVIRREGFGLCITGTRITLYDVMDYVKNDWPPKLIQHWLKLTDKQITDVMEYIKTHRTEVEAEYQQVLEYAKELRRSYEDKNRARFEKIKAMPPKPGQDKIRAKLKALKEKLAQSDEMELAKWGKQA